MLPLAVVLALMMANLPAARLVPLSPATFFSVKALVPPSLTTIATCPFSRPRVTVLLAALSVIPMYGFFSAAARL